jgi:DNA-binding MarR family transcriptional regulator
LAELAMSDEGQSETYGTVTSTYKTMQRAVADLLSKEHLTQPQFIALRILAKKGAMGMRKISDEMLVTPGNLTGIVDRLQRKGLISRRAREGDRRAAVIELTDKGRAAQEAVAMRYGRLMRRAFEAFTSDEQEALRRLLQKLERGMSRSTDET